MKLAIIGTAAVLLSLSPGCDNEPGAGKERAAVGAPVKVAPKMEATSLKQAQPSSAVTYVFGAAGSTLSFVGAKLTGKHSGGFGDFKGSLLVPDGKIEHGKIEATVQVSSVTSDAEKLTGHLKSAEFFDVEKFPTAKFVSTSISASGAAGGTHTVTGNLTLHGVTRSISFPATIKADGTNGTFVSEFVINRKDFGIVYPGKPDDMIKDDVLLQLKLAGKAGK